MNESDAEAALAAVADGDETRLGELCKWLSKNPLILGRYLAADLEVLIKSRGSSAGLQSLLDDLAARPDSVLTAFFPGVLAGEVKRLSGAIIGRASDLAHETTVSADAWPYTDGTLTVIATDPAQGRLGALRTTAWLQTVLGAIGLAAYARSRTLAPLALCPAFGMALFVDIFGRSSPVNDVALMSPGWPAARDELESLMEAPGCQELVADAAARAPTDVVQRRLTLASRWLQLASSALSPADAFVSLGIALETIAGDESKAAVVDKITKRAAVFLAQAAPEDERADVFFDELKRAKRMYDVRSRAAHGQFDEWGDEQPKNDAERDEFHRFVFDVALGFRIHARERNMRDEADFSKWWKRAEVDGLLT